MTKTHYYFDEDTEQQVLRDLRKIFARKARASYDLARLFDDKRLDSHGDHMRLSALFGFVNVGLINTILKGDVPLLSTDCEITDGDEVHRICYQSGDAYAVSYYDAAALFEQSYQRLFWPSAVKLAEDLQETEEYRVQFDAAPRLHFLDMSLGVIRSLKDGFLMSHQDVDFEAVLIEGVDYQPA